MPVDHFTREQFEAVLPRHKLNGAALHQPPTLENGQWVYTFPVGSTYPGAANGVGLRLYSGIGSDGNSAACGKDSIRVIVVRLSDGRCYGSKLQRWVTRQRGWEGRLVVLLRAMWRMALKAGPCLDVVEGHGKAVIRTGTPCGGFWGVYRCRKPGANKGRLFRKCDGACGGFEWLAEVEALITKKGEGEGK